MFKIKLIYLKRWLDPNQPDRNALCGLYSRKVYKIGPWHFDTIFIQAFNLIVWKLCAFRHRSSFGNFQQCFHSNFRLKWKFWILMVSSEISSLELSEIQVIVFMIISIKKKYCFAYRNQFFGDKWKILGFIFLEIFPKFGYFVNSDD